MVDSVELDAVTSRYGRKDRFLKCRVAAIRRSEAEEMLAVVAFSCRVPEVGFVAHVLNDVGKPVDPVDFDDRAEPGVLQGVVVVDVCCPGVNDDLVSVG